MSDSTYWRLLLHMPKDISEIDDPNFFISKNGKHNAKSELHETISAFLSEKSFGDDSYACKFPARKEWLSNQLEFKNLPKVKCKEYDTLIKQLDPQSITMVFSSAHINSPASMFGHTFLRIDSSYDSKLLSYAVNYSANVDQDSENGITFAIKGLFGGYHGQYSLLPYYDKLKEYSDSEQRDIWEYDLNLNKQEVMNTIRHIWELSNIYSDYYFFDENCSYNILWLLEVARPTVKLRDDFFYYVNPPETIFSILKENLVKKTLYRASKRTKLLKFEELLKENFSNKVISLAKSEMQPKEILDNSAITTKEKQQIIEASTELSEYYHIENVITKDIYLKTTHALSTARAKLGVGEKIEIKPPKSPDKGHNSTRLSLQNEYSNHKTSQLIGYRPVFQDIEDSDTGFLQGTQIEFLNTLIRYDNKKIDIEELNLLTIASYAPRSYFFKPFSWRTNFGWNRKYLDNDLYFTSSVAAGQTWSNFLGYSYILGEPIFYNDSKPIVGFGGILGIVIYEGSKFKTNIELKQRYYSNGKEQFSSNITQSWQFARNFALQIKYDYYQKDIKDISSTKLILNYFF